MSEDIRILGTRFGLAPCRGTAVVNQTLASPGFVPPGVHPQAFGPSWAGALRLRSMHRTGSSQLDVVPAQV
jgi:hypothetical protein